MLTQDLGGLSVSLSVGSMVPSPAPLFVMQALQQVQVNLSDRSPSGFQLTFHADRAAGLTPDFQLFSSGLFAAGNRVMIEVTVGGSSYTLMDGFVTRQELAHDKQSGASTISVIGEDVSVYMDLIELSFEWPALGDSAIALAVLLKYGLIGVVPVVTPTLSSMFSNPLEYVPQQNTTDRAYVQQLAQAHGNVFFVRPAFKAFGGVPVNYAYWGPPPRLAAAAWGWATGAQPALSVDMGSATNVESIDFQFDALAPVLFAGYIQDDDTDLQLPVATVLSTRLPPFASSPALPGDFPFLKTKLYNDPRLGIVRSLALAQAQTDYCSDRVVTAKSTVDTMRYGAIIQCPGAISVRGCGASYDGEYYVESVTHTIARGTFKQEVSMTREGLGTLQSSVSA
jgi:hypothetical protein